MVVKNERVKKILELIEKFRVVDVTHIVKLFFADYKNSQHATIKANAKLRALWKEKTLNRKRNDINSKYYYYIGPELKQVQHKLLRTELYVRLCEMYGIENVSCTNEYVWQGIRPDAYIEIKYKDKIYMFCAEIHISNNQFDIAKYERLDKQFKDIFPYVLVVTDRKLELKTKLKFIVVDCDFATLKELMPIGKTVFNAR